MKIDRPASPPVDFQKRMEQRKQAAPKEVADTDKQQKSSSPAEVDRVLNKVVKDIEKSGLSASEMHSSVDEAKVNGFLRSIDAESRQPRMSDDAVLALADKVAKTQQADAQAAAATFNPLDPERVAELV